jgi:hypothetical protein
MENPMKRLLLALVFLAATACSEQADVDRDHTHDHDHQAMVWVDTSKPDEVTQAFRRAEGFEQVSLWLEGPAPVLTARVENAGEWSGWMPVDITWSEDDRHVARLFVEGDAIEFRGLESMAVAGVELFTERRSSPEILTRNLPHAEPAQAPIGAIAPRSLVIPRSEWGARDPNKVCGFAVAPYRMSIHHTAVPDSDGGDPAARMRQMQAYHIDSLGWCDIGYHFVVSQSGNIYQGRSNEERTGTHVGGENSGNVGISLIGNFTSTEPSDVQLGATTEIVRWISETYGIELNRNNVKGHREWPGQSTACPGDRLLARIDDIIGLADTPRITDVDIWTETTGLDDRLVQGSSLDIPDALPGDTFEVSIYVRNNSDGPIREVELGYFVEEPYLVATDYIIESDAPEFAGEFGVNDADEAEGNPAKDQMGAEGSLTMFAFASGETKRVRITLEAVEPSIGRTDHPDVRGWLRNIGGVYAQEGFDDAPTLNEADEVLTAFAQHDVLSRAGWLFDSDKAEMLEGWVGCEQVDSAAIDAERGGLVVAFSTDDPCIVSPSWAAIDAATYDQLVLEIQSAAAPHDAALFWSSTDAETFNADRAVTFEVPEGGGTLVVDLAGHPEWTGSIERLRLDPVEGAAIDTDVVIGAVVFQSSSGQTTSVPGFDFAPGTPVAPDMGADPPTGDGGDVADGDDALDGEGEFETNDGCAQSGTSGAPAPLALLFLVGCAVRVTGRTRRTRR